MVGMVVAGMAGSYGREAARNRRNGGNGVGGGKRERKRKGGYTARIRFIATLAIFAGPPLNDR